MLRRGNPVTWTPEMDAALVRLRARGLSKKRCAEEIGVCEATCAVRMLQLGLAPGRMNRGRKRGEDVVTQ